MNTPLLNALLQGWAAMFAFIVALLNYLKLQTRISTATDGFLDQVAVDFFGDNIQRQAGQSDASFRAIIIANILRARGTRQSVIDVLTQLTGIAPIVFEPQRAADTGSYNNPPLAYNVGGGYGSLLLPFQSFVTAFRAVSGVANVGGYGSSIGCYSDLNTPVASSLEYASLLQAENFIPDSALFEAVNSVRPAGYKIWMNIEG